MSWEQLPGCCTTGAQGDLVVGRPEAVYFYSPDGRGPCFVIEGGANHACADKIHSPAAFAQASQWLHDMSDLACVFA